MSRRHWLLVLLLVGGAATVGVGLWAWRFWEQPSRVKPSEVSGGGAAPAPTMPTEGATPRGDVSIDARRQQLLGIRTVKATRGNLNQAVRTIGTVRYDETRVADVNVKLEGWVRDLMADYTGRTVRRGDALLTLYCPDLLAAEREYLLALSASGEMQASVIPEARQRAESLVAAARQRLVLWDVSALDLQRLEETRQPSDALSVRSPMDGLVVEKSVIKGAHVTPGQMLFKIADLSVVWLDADVYARDQSSVGIGSRATVFLDAYPGERITARVVYVYPDVDEQTRAGRVRYELSNPGGRLKPGMFATIETSTPGGSTGVTVPTDAVLDSGREQIVFVAEGDGHFTPRTVRIGKRLGADVEILDGLKEGEDVATGATFFLDSESQLRGALQGYVAPAGGGAAPSAASLQITFRTTPDPPTTGENQFEVKVQEPNGTAISDAIVTVQLFMPAMPTMNMPPMRNEVTLTPAGNGTYRGTGQVMMAGRWEGTVTVMRAGQRLGSSQMPVVAR